MVYWVGNRVVGVVTSGPDSHGVKLDDRVSGPRPLPIQRPSRRFGTDPRTVISSCDEHLAMRDDCLMIREVWEVNHLKMARWGAATLVAIRSCGHVWRAGSAIHRRVATIEDRTRTHDRETRAVAVGSIVHSVVARWRHHHHWARTVDGWLTIRRSIRSGRHITMRAADGLLTIWRRVAGASHVTTRGTSWRQAETADLNATRWEEADLLLQMGCGSGTCGQT